MKKLICFVLVVCFSFILLGCTDKSFNEEIISLVDNVEDYKEITIKEDDSHPYLQGEIEKVFQNKQKYVIYAIGHGGYKGDIELVVLIDNDIITNIKGYNIQETDDVGTKAFADAFLSQFMNRNITELDRFKGGNRPSDRIDILYVTGATYSSKAVLNAINTVIAWYIIEVA